MGKTSIEWTDRTWNPVTGCTKVSQGCKFCYAETFTERFKGKGSFENVVCHPDRLLQPFKFKSGEKVFVNSVSDLFHPDIPFHFIDKVMAVIVMNQENIFQVLTKRPERAKQYFSDETTYHRIINELKNLMSTITRSVLIDAIFRTLIDLHNTGKKAFTKIPNLWLGVSVEDQKTADARIPVLMQIHARIRFISAEPLLGPINLMQAVPISKRSGQEHNPENVGIFPGLDWIICGGESGPKARPMNPEWAVALQKYCEFAGIPFFFKQWGTWLPAEPEPVSEPQKSSQRFIRQRKKSDNAYLNGKKYKQFPIILKISK